MENEQQIVTPKISKKSNFLTNLLSLVLLLSIASAAYFAYQVRVLSKEVSQLKNGNMPITSNSQLLTNTDSTTDWKEFTIDELNLTFKLPPTLGNPGKFSKVETPSERGNQICWSLNMKQGYGIVKQVNAGGGSCVVDLFTIGATSVNHEAGRMSGFADYKLFKVENSIPDELISQYRNPYGVDILKIQGKNERKIDPLAESGFPINGTPGDGVIGAIIKYGDDVFQVITVQMVLNDILTEDIFDQILSTFKFTEQVDVNSISNTTSVLKYSLLTGWSTAKYSNYFEVGFDPSKFETKIAEINNDKNALWITKKNSQFPYSDSIILSLHDYNGGSRHQFLYDQIGEMPTAGGLYPDYKEYNYIISGKSCLVLDGITISQYPVVWAMCGLGEKAMMMTTFDRVNYLDILRTLKFTN